ncbi:hypothetical protein BGX24_005337, partial [Mortierella sp. AD032]
MDVWMKTVVKEHDSALSDFFYKRVFHECFELYSFSPEYSTEILVKKDDIISFCRDHWLTQQAVEHILLTFSRCYGQDGNVIFMPPSCIVNGENWDYGRALIDEGIATQLLSIVYMGDHWGAVHFDLKARVITFGDSLGRDTPVATIK